MAQAWQQSFRGSSKQKGMPMRSERRWKPRALQPRVTDGPPELINKYKSWPDFRGNLYELARGSKQEGEPMCRFQEKMPEGLQKMQSDPTLHRRCSVHIPEPEH